jgi:ADP-dependent NAD(P)H-hydrate dehydratase / NAD(P)H-hydrate epimerase
LKKLFYSVSALDDAVRSRFGLSDELMMEHAALAMANEIASRFDVGVAVLIVTGCGNNGADGYALARLLHRYDVCVLEHEEPKNELCRLQKSRALRCGVRFVTSLGDSYSVVVDAVFGSGLSKPLSAATSEFISKLNALKAYKIACDTPCGLFSGGSGDTVFAADLTVTMGAGKIGQYLDFAKDFVGEVVVAGLGVSAALYEDGFAPDGYLLEKTDMTLPLRKQRSSHKGDYGHLAAFVGEKEGAGILCGLAALGFGCGRVTLVSKGKLAVSPELMQDIELNSNISTVCIGSGLGDSLDINEVAALAIKDLKFIIDADMFYKPEILKFLDKDCVLTPHPKEFAELLKSCGLGDFDTALIQNERFALAKKFSQKYPKPTLILKGANTIIAQNGELFVCDLGSPALAKAGSGDVLAGLVGALVAQGYEPLEAAKSAALAHALASQRFENNFSLTPLALIEKIKAL